MGYLSTHVLDTMTGKPAAGMRIDLAARDGESWRRVKTLETNADGRTNAPVLSAEEIRVGEFEMTFHVAAYYQERGIHLPDPPFIDCVPVRFGISLLDAHYHVPLLCTPWSYSTYLGS